MMTDAARASWLVATSSVLQLSSVGGGNYDLCD